MRQSNESWSRLIFLKRQLIEIFKGKNNVESRRNRYISEFIDSHHTVHDAGLC